jgi:hypothetical protein
MIPLEYVMSALPWWDEYAALLLVSILLHWFFLIKPCTRGIYDPLFMVVMASSFGWPIVWFMYLRGDIRDIYAISFSLCQLAFALGLFLARGRKDKDQPANYNHTESPRLAIGVFAFASTIHLASTITVWILAGIPLFRASRLGAFENSGGFGVLERLSGSCGQIAIFAAFYLLIGINVKRLRSIYYLYIACFIVSLIFSGSKAALFTLGYSIFTIAFLFTKFRCEKTTFYGGSIGKNFLIISAIFSIFVVSIQNDTRVIDSFTHLIFRFVSFGDVYIEAYINNNIEYLKGSNPFIGLFGGFLSTFRLWDVNEIYPTIGWQLTLLIIPDMDIVVGPNAMHPVFFYHYFGVLAFVFSFIIGLIASFLNNHLFFKQHNSFFQTLIYFMAYSSLVYLSMDFTYALDMVASAIIGLSCVFIPLLFIRPQAILFVRRRLKANLSINKSL